MAAVFEQDVCVWYWINIVVDTTLGKSLNPNLNPALSNTSA